MSKEDAADGDGGQWIQTLDLDNEIFEVWIDTFFVSFCLNNYTHDSLIIETIFLITYIFVRLFQTNFETPEASNMAELYSKKKTPDKQTSTKQTHLYFLQN